MKIARNKRKNETAKKGKKQIMREREKVYGVTHNVAVAVFEERRSLRLSSIPVWKGDLPWW